MEWIKVEECLPANGKAVLIFVEFMEPCSWGPTWASRGIFEGTFEHAVGWVIKRGPNLSWAVLGWMPRPRDLEIPKEPLPPAPPTENKKK